MVGLWRRLYWGSGAAPGLKSPPPTSERSRGERSRSEANEGEGVGHKKQQQTGMKGSEDYDRKETV